MTMITPSYLGETIEYSSLHACRSTLEDPTRKQPRNTDKLKMLSIVCDLEKAAMKKGYPLAIGLVSGFCQLCEKCTLDRVSCVHPTQVRYSEEGVGVNVQATAKNAGIKFTFPFQKTPETYALLLID